MMIAERTLTLRLPDGERSVKVALSAPTPIEQHWSCAYSIGWPEGERRFRAEGLDSLQALVLAMQMVSAELYASKYHAAGQLYFEQPGSGFGIPVAPNMRSRLTSTDAAMV